jgi:hypothetical protein
MNTNENTTSNDGGRTLHTMDIADNTLVLILAGGRGTRLHEMTDRRSKPAVYFGGNWRIIDFTLSNCLNSIRSCATCSMPGLSCRATAASLSTCCRRASRSTK